MNIKKVIINQIPTDENGFPLLPMETIEHIHNSMKETLKEGGILVVSTPFKYEIIDL